MVSSRRPPDVPLPVILAPQLHSSSRGLTMVRAASAHPPFQLCSQAAPPFTWRKRKFCRGHPPAMSLSIHRDGLSGLPLRALGDDDGSVAIQDTGERAAPGDPAVTRHRRGDVGRVACSPESCVSAPGVGRDRWGGARGVPGPMSPIDPIAVNRLNHRRRSRQHQIPWLEFGSPRFYPSRLR